MSIPAWEISPRRDRWLASNRAQFARRENGEGFVYVAEMIGTGLLKIGFSLNPQKRMLALRADYRNTFRLLGAFACSNAEERRLHRALARHVTPALRREFYRRGDILAWLAEHLSQTAK